MLPRAACHYYTLGDSGRNTIMSFSTQVTVMGKGSCEYHIVVSAQDVLHLVRNASVYDDNAFDINLAGQLVGHVGGRELSFGLAKLLDDLIEGIDYRLTARAMEPNNFEYPHSWTGQDMLLL